MNLWIRSQGKMKLVNNCNLYISNEIRNEYVIEDLNNKYLKLGTYKTKERALEVLNEIEERIMLINTINMAKDTNSLIACKIALTEEKIKGLSYPYQMPKE